MSYESPVEIIYNLQLAEHKSDFIATAENKKRAKEDVDLSPAEKELFQDDDDDET